MDAKTNPKFNRHTSVPSFSSNFPPSEAKNKFHILATTPTVIDDLNSSTIENICPTAATSIFSKGVFNVYTGSS